MARPIPSLNKRQACWHILQTAAQRARRWTLARSRTPSSAEDAHIGEMLEWDPDARPFGALQLLHVHPSFMMWKVHRYLPALSVCVLSSLKSGARFWVYRSAPFFFFQQFFHSSIFSLGERDLNFSPINPRPFFQRAIFWANYKST